MLIHTCCANCYLHFLENIKDDSQDITLLYYNPNIHPRSEWLTRLEALKKVSKAKNFDLKVINYKPKEYFDQIKILQKANSELIKNPKTRCPFCWTLRLEKTFAYAQKHGHKQVTTTLLMSQHQDHKTITRIGHQLAKKYGVNFLVFEDIKPCEKFCGFYKQNYCGCIYSLSEKFEEKYL